MEENKTPNKSEKEIIKENMLTLYKAHQEEEKNPVDEISYYKQIVLQSEKSPIMYGLQDIYPVNIKEPEKIYGNRILLYQNGTPIAMIDENSNIKFSSEYLEQMKSLNPSIYALLHSMNGKHYELPQIQEVSEKLPDINLKQEVEDFKLSKEELENAKQNETIGQGMSEEENEEALKSRIKFIYNIANENQIDTLILGAYGCGVFGQDPKKVASLFLECAPGKVNTILFAIPKGRNYESFKEVLCHD